MRRAKVVTVSAKIKRNGGEVLPVLVIPIPNHTTSRGVLCLLMGGGRVNWPMIVVAGGVDDVHAFIQMQMHGPWLSATATAGAG